MAHVKLHNVEKSALALHHINTSHNFSLENVSLVKQSNNRNLDMWEVIYMKKHKKYMKYEILQYINIRYKNIKCI